MTLYFEGLQGETTVEGVALKPRASKPTQFHEFDISTGGWVGSVPDAIKSRLAEVPMQRERCNQQPIAYAGTRFDADDKAQRNISAWQTQLAAGAVLPPGFVWRDFYNVDHPCDAAFINGMGAAVTMRGTLLYAAGWAHKAAINALTTVEAVMAYPLDAGWP